jgi:hypothetical protein
VPSKWYVQLGSPLYHADEPADQSCLPLPGKLIREHRVWGVAMVSISLVVFAVLDQVADVRALRQTAKEQRDACTRSLIVRFSVALLIRIS